MKKVAISYFREHQIPCIPCSRGNEGKGPTFAWKKYLEKKPTDVEIEEMFNLSLKHTPDGRSPNIAALCGKVSGIGLVDIDKVNTFLDRGFQLSNDCPLSQTPNDGYHEYYRLPNNINEPISTYSLKDESGGEIFSIRVDGSIALVPPSRIMKTTRFYKWVKGRAIWELEMPELPEHFLKLIVKGKTNKIKRDRQAPDKIIELTSEQINYLVKLLSLYWIEGQRYHLCGYTSGCLAIDGYSFNSAEHLITSLAERNDDDELHSDRIPCVKSTYEKYQAEGELSIKGWSGLQEIVSPPDLEKLKDILKPRGPQSNSKMKALTVQDILSTDVDVTRFTCKPFATKGSLTLVSGPPAVGKSFLMLSLAKSISTGSPFLGQFETLKGKVAYFDSENPLEVLKDRLQKMNISSRDISFYSFSNTNIVSDFNEFTGVAKQHDVLIFDSLVHFHDRQENNAQEMAQVMERFKKLADECECSIILIHQQRKPAQNETSSDLASIRGSQQITYDIDMVFTITEEKGGGKIIECQKPRLFKKPADVIYEMKETDNGIECLYIGSRQEQMDDTKLETTKSLIPYILRSYGATSKDNPMCFEDIDKHFKAQFVVVGKTNLRRGLNELVADDKSGVKVITGSNNRKLYYIVDTETP